MRKLVFLCLPLLAGCWASAIKSRATFDLTCPQAQIEVRTLSAYMATYDVRGCGKQANYVVRDGQPLLNSAVVATEPDAPAAAPESTAAPATVPAAPAATPAEPKAAPVAQPEPAAPAEAIPDAPQRAY